MVLASFKDLQSMAVSKWKPVRTGVPQGSPLGSILFNAFLNYAGSEKDCTLSKFADDSKLCGAVDTPEQTDTIQRDLDRPKECTYANLMKFNKAKSKVLYLGWGNPQPHYRLWD